MSGRSGGFRIRLREEAALSQNNGHAAKADAGALNVDAPHAQGTCNGGASKQVSSHELGLVWHYNEQQIIHSKSFGHTYQQIAQR